MPVERVEERHPTHIHFVQGFLTLRIEVVPCPPKRYDPRRRHGIRHPLRA